MSLLRNKPAFPQKIIFIFLGIAFCTVLLGLGLRLGGVIFTSLQEYTNRRSLFKKGSYRIMCLGESTTANAYPPFLEEILNQRNIGVKFSVIDKGRIGITTVGILFYLEEDLNTYKPDMVITMMGENDRAISYYKDIPEVNTRLFQHSSVYRFIRLIYMHIVHKLKNEDIYGLDKAASEKRTESKETAAVVEKEFSSNEESFKKAIALNPGNDRAYSELGWLCREQGKLPEAEASFKKAIALNPKNDGAYSGLGRLYAEQGRQPEAEEFIKKAIALNPSNNQAYSRLGWIYRGEQGRLPEAEESFKKAIALNPDDDWKKEWNYRAIGTLYREMNRIELAEEYSKRVSYAFSSLTSDNYHRLKAILDKRGIRLICVQYPMRSLEPLKRIFEGERGVIFVDNERVFKGAVKQASYREYFADMFAGDFGHCTPKGNRLLAKNIADVILKEVFGK
jgi:tetratricopeptide (TPR) repeat protein